MKRRSLPSVDKDELPPKQKEQVEDLQTCAEGYLEELNAFDDLVGCLRDEIAILKGEKKRPIFKPSRMNEEAGEEEGNKE